MRILIFGGTTEGRERAINEYEQGNNVLVCVATDSGKEELPNEIPCLVGRLDDTAMRALCLDYKPDRLIDATHPFAAVVSTNIKKCANALSLPLECVTRDSDVYADFSKRVLWVNDAFHAAQLANQLAGNVFLSTGSNTVDIYSNIIDTDRLYVRILPNETSIRKCVEAGIPSSHIMAMQGPFSEEINTAVYHQWNIRILVTKDSGDTGGVRQKVLPALEAGIMVIMIRRPNV